MKYTGSCHCGQVKFTAEGEIEQAMECNCSHCSRKGFLLWFVPRSKFQLLTPESDLTLYKFNRHVIDHLFCPKCGVQGFGFGKNPSTGEETAAVNIRCLEDLDLSTVKRIPVDGKSF